MSGTIIVIALVIGVIIYNQKKKRTFAYKAKNGSTGVSSSSETISGEVLENVEEVKETVEKPTINIKPKTEMLPVDVKKEIKTEDSEEGIEKVVKEVKEVADEKPVEKPAPKKPRRKPAAKKTTAPKTPAKPKRAPRKVKPTPTNNQNKK